MSQDAAKVCAICGGDHPTEMCETKARPGPAGSDGEASAASRPGMAVGDRVGGYRLAERLGAGATADVFLGIHTVVSAQVAVKALRPDLHDDPELVRRFIGEARATNLVRHEHILEILDIGQFNGWQHYSVMELLRGQPLKEAMGGAAWPLEKAAPILSQICEALSAAHAGGVVHRDLKPDNIYLATRNGQPHVKIVDFGSARRATLSDGEARTTVGTVLGTANYMAPEQAMGKEVDARADVYALGVIMFQMATGRLPFQAQSAGALLAAVMTQEPPAPSSVNRKIAPAWESIIVRCLAKAREERFPSMSDLGRALVRARRSPEAPVVDGVDESQRTVIADAQAVQGAASPPLRYTTSFAVRAGTESGLFPESLVVTDVSLGGMFLATNHTLPPVFSRVTVRVPTPDGPVEFAGEVVRVEEGSDGRRGFAIHFDPLDAPRSAALKALLARVAPGDKVAAGDDPEAARLLARFSTAKPSDHYALLGVAPHQGTREIGEAAKRLATSTEPGRFPKMSAAQRREMQALRARLAEAEDVLTDLPRRARHDAERGNFLGVAQCLREGLAVEKLGELRRAFLADHPRAEAAVRPYLGTAKAHEAKGEIEAAARDVASALAIDGLNIGLQRLYWDLRRQVKPRPA